MLNGKRDKLESFFSLFLLVYLFIHLFYWSLRLGDNFTFSNGMRFLFRHTLPATLPILLWRKNDLRCIFKNKLWRNLATSLLMIAVMFLTFSLIGGFIFRIPYATIFNMKWQYSALTEYYLAFIIYFYLLKKKDYSTTETILTVSMLLLIAGVIYELPIYPRMNPHVGIYYHKSHPFLINGRWLLFPALFWYFKQTAEIPKRSRPKLILASILLILFSGYYAIAGSIIHMTHPYTRSWIPRIPTLTFLAYLINQLKRKERGEENVNG